MASSFDIKDRPILKFYRNLKFYTITLDERGRPIRLRQFKTISRSGEFVTLVEIDKDQRRQRKATIRISDLINDPDKAIPFKPNHNGTIKNGGSVIFRYEKSR
jgi:hypothetical protein